MVAAVGSRRGLSVVVPQWRGWQAQDTGPLWLADNLAVPLELEESYEQSCGILNIP